MRKFFSFYRIYLKILLVEKVSFFYSLLLPILIAILYLSSFDGVWTMEAKFISISLFWSFIIINTYINGIGLQLSTIRDQGTLKTYQAITGNRYIFLIAIVLVQFTVAFVCVLLFSTVISVILNAFSIKLMMASVLTLVFSFPLAIACITIAALPFKTSNVSTILNILTFPLFFLAASGVHGVIGYLNPFTIVIKMSSYLLDVNFYAEDQGLADFSYLLITMSVITLISVFIIRRFNLSSLTQR